MNLHLTSTTTPLPKRRRNPCRTALGLAALALTVSAGIVAWQVTGQSTVTSSEPATASTRDSTAPATTGYPTDTSILYIVRSQQDANLIQRIATEIGGPHMASSHTVTLEVLVSNWEAATIAESLPRTPGTVFVDLRSP